MRALHITNNYPTNQHPIFGIFVKEQIDSLTELGVTNEVFFINGREKGKIEYVKSIFRLRKFLNNKKYDIIHCHHAFSAVCFILSGYSRRFKSVVSYQNDPSIEHGRNLYRFIRKNSDAIILKNNSSTVNHKTIFNQPNGVNTDFFSPMNKEKCKDLLNLNKNKQHLLFVSSNLIREQKRYDRFQRVLEILREEYQLNNIEELKLIKVKRELVPYYMNAADVHLLTSDHEGSPNSVKECMSCNTPIVSTNVGNVEEMLYGVDGCFVSNSFDEQELAFYVDKALKSRTTNARDKIFEMKLDIDSVAKKIIELYENICKLN